MAPGARDVGVVLQSPGRNLLPYANALENWSSSSGPAVAGVPPGAERARELLGLVGRLDAGPSRCEPCPAASSKRLAVAAALCNEPRLPLADEPTSQLDEDNSARLAELVGAVNRELKYHGRGGDPRPHAGAAMERTSRSPPGSWVGPRPGGTGTGDRVHLSRDGPGRGAGPGGASSTGPA